MCHFYEVPKMIMPTMCCCSDLSASRSMRWVGSARKVPTLPRPKVQKMEVCTCACALTVQVPAQRL